VKRAWADAARADEVRGAARGWAEAKAIDSSTLAAVESAYPDARVRIHPAWRVLVFLIACVAIVGLHFGVFHRSVSDTWPTAMTAAALLAATEWLRGTRFSGTGADAASSFLAYLFAIAGAFMVIQDVWKAGTETSFDIVLGFSFVLTALFAWRWGFWAFAAVSAASLCVLAARLPPGRLIWFVLSLALLAMTDGLRDRESIAPPHRSFSSGRFAPSRNASRVRISLAPMLRRRACSDDLPVTAATS
jgi:hypothetical protein